MATISTVHKTVARQLVERAGIDVEKLLDLLVRNAAAELTIRSERGARPRKEAATSVRHRTCADSACRLHPPAAI